MGMVTVPLCPAQIREGFEQRIGTEKMRMRSSDKSFTRGQTRAFQALERELSIGNSNCFIVEDSRFPQYFPFLHWHPAVKSRGEQFSFFREALMHGLKRLQT